MNNKDIRVVKEVSRLKVLFTVEKFGPLTIRAFSIRGYNKIAKNLDLNCDYVIDTKLIYQDTYNKPKLRVIYEAVKREKQHVKRIK